MTTTSHSNNGKKGFEETTKKHFNGDKEKHTKWLGDYGCFCYARNMIGFSWWKIKCGAYGHPGAHPAWSKEESKLCPDCKIPKRDCICELLKIPF
jgi:hypothetical protein